MTVTLSIIGFGVLFALYGVVRRAQPKCGGNCGACTSGCDAITRQDQP